MPLRVPSPSQADLVSLVREIVHTTYIFPEDTDEFITFTAGVGDNEWSDWVEIEDSAGNKFSDKAVTNLHIASLMVEDSNVKDKVYLIEIAYGAAKTFVAPYRFIAGELVKMPAIQQVRVRANYVPAGEDIFYRMKCEDGGKTCSVHIRYHLH